jgi:hypothetical protein
MCVLYELYRVVEGSLEEVEWKGRKQIEIE